MAYKITDDQINDWIEKFDNTDSNALIGDILNGKIKLEVMSDSVFAYWSGELELAEQLYKEMWND